MFARMRRGQRVACAFAIAIAAGVGIAVPAVAASQVPDATLVMHAGGDRTSSGSGKGGTDTTGPTGGTVAGTDGIRFTVTNTSTGAVLGRCTTGTDAALGGTGTGMCEVSVTDGTPVTVTQDSVPTGWFRDTSLGTGTTSITTPTPYSSITLGPVTGTVNVSAQGTGKLTRSGVWAASRINPQEPAECGLRIALLFDLSLSITTDHLAKYLDAGKAFVEALQGTESHVSLFTFSTDAPAANTGVDMNLDPPGSEPTDQAGVRKLMTHIGRFTTVGSTNWDRGIWQIQHSSNPFNLAIVLTDGNPNAWGMPANTDSTDARFIAVENGIFSANALKLKGTRIIVVAFGLPADSTGSASNFEAISGPNRGSDFFDTGFDGLKALLERIALTNCARLEIKKVATPTHFDAAHQTITYTYTVTNPSDSHFTLHNITVHDDKVGHPITDCVRDGAPTTTLAPGQSATCTATIMTTQAQVDAGEIVNTAHATGTTPQTPAVTVSSPPTSAIVIARRHPSIEITKTPSPLRYSAVGQVIRYRYVVTNTGDVDLHNVRVADPSVTGLTCGPVQGSTLAPGATMTCTATHTVTQGDLNAGSIKNTATATGKPDGLDEVKDQAKAEVTGRRVAEIEITKTATPATYTTLGQMIDYAYVVQNTGNVTLTNVQVTDPSVTDLSCTPVNGSTLQPGEMMHCTATHTVTQGDLTAGSIKNTGTATGTPPPGLEPPTDKDTAEVTEVGQPSITIEKTASPQIYSGVGETIHYAYTVENTGNVPLSNVTVADPSVTDVSCTPANGSTLQPGEMMHCTATHTVTQDDLNAGSIENMATVTGTSPANKTVTDDDDATVFAQQDEQIDITKQASPQVYDRPGQNITYTYKVKNTGNVTLTNVSVTDNLLTGITCRPPQGSTLEPGETMICKATHITTQKDVDNGRILNTGTATGQPPTGPPIDDQAVEEVSAEIAPSIAVVKSATPDFFTGAGQVITYTYVVTNTGNVTLHRITVDDSEFGLISCPSTTLAPGRSMTCTHTHATTAADVDRGHILNEAVATGHPPNGEPVESLPGEVNISLRVAPVVPVTG